MELAVTTIERRKTCRDSTKKKKEATRMSEREPITDRLAGPAAASSRLNYLVLYLFRRTCSTTGGVSTVLGSIQRMLAGPGLRDTAGTVISSSGVKETDERGTGG